MQPPVLLEDISTEGLSPDILVAGDIISKKYDFMMGDLDNNPYKIAQVEEKFLLFVHDPITRVQVIRKFKMVAENNTYFLNVGPNIDVAFLVMCTFAIDELFSDD